MDSTALVVAAIAASSVIIAAVIQNMRKENHADHLNTAAGNAHISDQIGLMRTTVDRIDSRLDTHLEHHADDRLQQ